MLGGKNKQQHRPLGYTIVEVMIVLAISGIMFVIAANFINGKQERAAFTQGSNETGSVLQGIVGDITDGHYSDVPLQCSFSGTTLTAKTGAGGDQGQNQNCVFLGKIVRFYAPGSSSDKTNYGVYSIAAARSITDFPNDLVSAIGGLTTDSVIPQSLYVKSMFVTDTANPPGIHSTVFNIGFAQGVGSVSGDGVYLSGAQQPVQLVYADTPGGDVSAISAGTDIKRAKSAFICLSDGTQNAVITIGGSIGNNNQLDISVRPRGTAPCG
jgi:prepilin-type N-terminal cleavage/methylation domain-containing protein